MLPDDDDSKTPRERLEESLKSPYPPDGDVWDGLLEAIAQEFEAIERARAQVYAAQFVDTADPASLNRLASIFDMERRTTEPVDVFRARVKTALRAQLTSATIPEIRDVIGVILGEDADAVDIREPFDLQDAHINVDVPLETLDESEITDSDFIDIVDNVVAAGVSVGIHIDFDFEAGVEIGDRTHIGPEIEHQDGVSMDDDVSIEYDEIQSARVNEGRVGMDVVMMPSVWIEETHTDGVAIGSRTEIGNHVAHASGVSLEDAGGAAAPVEASSTVAVSSDFHVQDDEPRLATVGEGLVGIDYVGASN